MNTQKDYGTDAYPDVADERRRALHWLIDNGDIEAGSTMHQTMLEEFAQEPWVTPMARQLIREKVFIIALSYLSSFDAENREYGRKRILAWLALDPHSGVSPWLALIDAEWQEECHE